MQKQNEGSFFITVVFGSQNLVVEKDVFIN